MVAFIKPGLLAGCLSLHAGIIPAYAFSFWGLARQAGKQQSGKQLRATTASVAGFTLLGSGGGNSTHWAQTDPFKQKALFPP
jgi:hypothetical protein